MMRIVLAAFLGLACVVALAAQEAPPALEARKLLAEGEILFAAGKIEEALSRFRSAREKAPTLVEAHQRYQDAMIALGRGREAGEEYRAFASDGPFKESALACYLLGRISADLMQKEQHFRAALAKAPDFFWAWHGLGYLYERLDRWEESEAAFRRLVALRPDSPLGYNGLGFCYMEQGKNEAAEQAFAEALKRDPRDTEALLNLSYLALRQGNYELAVERARKLLEVDKDNPWAHNNLGKAYYHLGRYAAAERAFKAALAQPRYDTPEIAYLNLSFIYRRRRKYDLAAEACRKAIELRPDFAYAYNELAQVQYHQGQYAQAWENVRRAHELGYEPRREFLEALRAKMPEPRK